jgi:ATP-binding cassette subfamily B protein
MHTGQLIQRCTSDVDTIQRFFSEEVMGILRIFFLFSLNFMAIYFINRRLAWLSIIVVPIVVLLSYYFFKRIFKTFDAYQEQEGKVSAILQENLTGARIVKAFARQTFEEEKFEEQNRKQLLIGRQFNLSHALYWPSSHFVCALQIVLGIGVGALMTFRGEITLGAFLAYTGMINGIIWPLQQMGRLIAQLSTSFVSYQRVATILEQTPEALTVGLGGKGIKAHGLQGKVEFRSLSFAYEKEKPILRNINFSCKPGDIVGILGESGSGKSTLVNLLPRFYEANEDVLFIDDVPIQEYSKAFLRQNIGIVEQQPFLFSASIRENLTYGVRGDISQEEIEQSTKIAAIHHAIAGFPQGYDTLVGERGVTLSGGQKQRLAIARTILKDPSILILDDATSAVDAQTENLIRLALRQLTQRRTTFIIAHRVLSLMDADLILVLKKGQIIQQGTHRQLINQKGFYKEVFDLQTQIEEELDNEVSYEAV